MVIATSNQPFDGATAVSLPLGRIWKYLSYLNLSFTAVPNRVMKTLPWSIATGIAGAIMLVP